jgi:hypothetical protein
MEYTHNFEISFVIDDGGTNREITVSGEIYLDGRDDTYIKTDAGMELSLDQRDHLQKFFHALCLFNQNCLDVNTLEVNKK